MLTPGWRPGWIRDTPDGATFAVRVAPRASRTKIMGLLGKGSDAALKIALTAAPVEGKANQELIAQLASFLDVPRSRVEVIAGAHSKNKVVRVSGRSAVEVGASLAKLLPDNWSEVP